MVEETLLDLLIELLARLVADGDLTEVQAASIVAYWQDRADAELAHLLSLPVAAGVGEREQDEDAALLPLLLAGVRAAPGDTLDARIRAANRIQDNHAAEAQRLADELMAGKITVAEWQGRTRAANAAAIDAMAQLGSTRMTMQLQRRIDEIEREQAAFLQRFADEVSARRITDAMPQEQRDALGLLLATWTAAYIGRRAASYSGAARRVFFLAAEGDIGGQGWIIRYEAHDDDRTCSACLQAQGYYLPGDGPMPGEVCYGGGACRCERVPVYDLALWQQLAGARV